MATAGAEGVAAFWHKGQTAEPSGIEFPQFWQSTK
jgi:hypothetical protein